MSTEKELLDILDDWRKLHWGGHGDEQSPYDDTQRNDARDEIELWDGAKRSEFLVKFIQRVAANKDNGYSDVEEACDFIEQNGLK